MTQAAVVVPREDLNRLWNLGLAGAPLVQYLKWADELRIFRMLHDKGELTVQDIVLSTPLSARGADALLGVLSSLKVVCHSKGKYRLSQLGEDYLVKGRDFYVGPSLYGMLNAKLPPRLRKGEKVRQFSRTTGSLWQGLKYCFSSRAMGRPERLAVQHSRNYPSAVVAVDKGLFDGVRHLLDVGGGSGAFAIPLIRSRKDIVVSLLELPRALPHIRAFLDSQGIVERVELLGGNMHRPPWPELGCDAVLLGNILHFCSDEECGVLLEEAFRLLPAGGRLLVHEMLWNENKDGPLSTALWNFWMTSVSAGRQRTLEEVLQLLRAPGFQGHRRTDTWGSFSMLTCTKPD